MIENLKCESCKYMIRVNKHPKNETIGKGEISESMGFVCTYPYSLFQGDPFIFMDTDQGGCEMHTDAWKGSMTIERYRTLNSPREMNKINVLVGHSPDIFEPKLTESEQKEWCYCENFDGMLVHVSQIEYKICNNNCKKRNYNA